MERQYRLMHRLGLTPWDREGAPPMLVDLVEGPAALRPGRALDIGCGTGRDAVYLADHGWQVTAVDVSPHAIDKARRRSDDVRWHVADLGEPSMERVVEPLAGSVALVLDVGCLHGLDLDGRAAWGRAVNRVAAPHARLLLRAGRPRAGWSLTPQGIDSDSTAALLGPGWSDVDEGSSGWSTYARSAT
jgi:SAM-dependent methyltransferase